MEGFIVSFKRIWEHTKHKGRGGSSLHGAAVKPSSKHFLTYCLTNAPCQVLVNPGTLSISAHTLFADCCKFEYYGTCFMSTLRVVIFWKLKLSLLKKCKIPCCFLGCIFFSQFMQCSYCQWRATKFIVKISDNSLSKLRSGQQTWIFRILFTTNSQHCTFSKTK